MKRKHILCYIITFCMLMTLAAPPVFAASTTTYTKGDFTISATEGGTLTEGTDFSYASNVLTIKSSTAMTISGTTTRDRIEIAADVSADITLSGVDINVSSSGDSYKAALKIADNSKGNVKITLAAGTTNSLISGGSCAGLQKNGEYSKDLGTLTIGGNGTLYAQSGDPDKYSSTGAESGWGAGIGGGDGYASAKITISGGSITARCADGAGIGGGNGKSGSYITISNGTVNASTGGIGAGIGGGYNGSGSNITISGGKVTATAYDGGSGIGGGSGGSASNITIKNAVVMANAGESDSNGAGIGGKGSSEEGIKDITIENSTVTAIGAYGAGIGSAFDSSAAVSNIKIKGGSVKAESRNGGAKIGTGAKFGTDGIMNGTEITPTDGSGNNVYLLTINNPQDKDVYIDGTKYGLKNHKALDSNDTNVYVYLKSGHHIVKTGDTQSCYHYANGFSACTLSTYGYDNNKHWQNCSASGCSVKHNESGHSYSWQSNESQYWKACVCGRTTGEWIDIPTVTINGSDKVSRANDYKYTVSYPTGVTITSATGTLQNGEYVVSKSGYSGDSLKIDIEAKTSDGFILKKSKTVAFKGELQLSDFTFNPPANTVYNEQPMTASVTSTKIDSSKITVNYYRGDNLLASAPTDVGTYTVKIDAAESDDYAAKNNITDSAWCFTITQATPTVIDEDKTTARIRRGRALEEATVIYDSTFMGVNGVLGGTYEWADKSEIASSEKGYEMIFTPDNANYKPVAFNVQVTFYATTSLYTVKFNTNGAGTIENQIVAKNNMVIEPEEPVKEGYIFRGWYTDRELTEEYDFDTLVKGSFTLYAKWIEDESEEIPGDSIDSDNPFTDVNEDDWFYEGVMYVSKNKLMNGVTNTEFAPNLNLTRGMLVTVLYRLAGEPDVDGTLTFEDVESGSYYNRAVIWAQQNGIVTGIGENQFAPDENITREQIAAIFYRYAKAMGYDVSVGENTNILSYADYDEISAYDIDAVQYAVGSGLMQGKTDSTFNPADFATRGEIATILQRFIEANE